MRVWNPFAVTLTLALVLGPTLAARATQYVITSPLDVVAVDGACTLREALRASQGLVAVNECPAGEGDDSIYLETSVTLSATTDADGNPDLDVDQRVSIYGNAADVALTPALGARTFDVHASARLALENVDVTCKGQGAGITANQAEEVWLYAVRFTQCVAAGPGGALAASATQVRLMESGFIENTGTDGGAVSITGSFLFATGVVFARNGASGRGGAIALTDVTGQVAWAAFDRNSALGDGGAIALTGGSLTMEVASFARSVAGGSGGAVAAVTAGDVKASLCTFAGNRATVGGGAIDVDATEGTFQSKSSLFADNTVGATAPNDIEGPLVSYGFNLFETSPIGGEEDLHGVEVGPVRYSPSAKYPGGMIAEMPFEGPHIDAGNCHESFLTGEWRIVDIVDAYRLGDGACDIGAREILQPLNVTGLQVVSTRTTSPCAGLRIEAWIDSDLNPEARAASEPGSSAILCDGTNFSFAAAARWEGCQTLRVGADQTGAGEPHPVALAAYDYGERSALALCAATALAPPLLDVTTVTTEACGSGAQRVRAGYDRNLDGALGADEGVLDETYCRTAAMKWTLEQNDQGLVQMYLGRDLGLDGQLSEYEFTGGNWREPSSRDFLFASVSPAPVAACPGGGLTLSLGRDLDESGAVDPSEPTSSAVLCDDGKSAPSMKWGTSSCHAGGVRLDLVAGDANASVQSCMTGPAIGAARVTTPCAGMRLDVWTDTDGINGRSASETATSEVLCDPAAYTIGFAVGGQSWGSDCSGSLWVGPDSDHDGVLDEASADLFRMGYKQGLGVCTGVMEVDVRTLPAGGQCAAGGRDIVTGTALAETGEELRTRLTLCDSAARDHGAETRLAPERVIQGGLPGQEAV